MKLNSLFYSKKLESLFNKNRKYIYILCSAIFVLLLYFNFNDIENREKDNQISQLTKIINSFDSKSENIDLLVTIVSLENYIKEKYIKIVSLKLIDKGFTLELEGEYTPTIGMLDFIEKRNSLLKVEKFNARYDKRRKVTSLFLDVKVLKDKKTYKEKENIALVNVFDKEEIKESIKIKKDEKIDKKVLLKLHAIVENMAFINDSWFKVGDKIKEQKIVFIGSDYIKLKTNNNETKLWMYNSGTVR